jgi:putative addiction module component (TIGR02574 family)
MPADKESILMEIQKLSAVDQIQLANSIYSQQEAITYDTELSKAQNHLLHKRLEKYESGKMQFKSWEEVKANLKARKK